MEQFPSLFLGKTLFKREIPSYGGFDYPISMYEFDRIKLEVINQIPEKYSDKDYLIFLCSEPSGYDGGFDLFLSAISIVIPSLSKQQKNAIQLLKSSDSGVLPVSCFKQNTLNFLLREKIFILLEQNVSLNNQIKHLV